MRSLHMHNIALVPVRSPLETSPQFACPTTKANTNSHAQRWGTDVPLPVPDPRS